MKTYEGRFAKLLDELTAKRTVHFDKQRAVELQNTDTIMRITEGKYESKRQEKNHKLDDTMEVVVATSQKAEPENIVIISEDNYAAEKDNDKAVVIEKVAAPGQIILEQIHSSEAPRKEGKLWKIIHKQEEKVFKSSVKQIEYDDHHVVCNHNVPSPCHTHRASKTYAEPKAADSYQAMRTIV